jgi:hypothetical protein
VSRYFVLRPERARKSNFTIIVQCNTAVTASGTGASNAPIAGSFDAVTSGSVSVTPTTSTPSSLYYQCTFHPNMGYKVEIIAATPMPTPAPTPTPTPTPVVDNSNVPGSVGASIEKGIASGTTTLTASVVQSFSGCNAYAAWSDNVALGLTADDSGITDWYRPFAGKNLCDMST